MIDYTINIVGLAQIVVFLAGGLALFYGMKGDIRVLRHDLRHLEVRQEALGEAFKQLGDVLRQVAVQDTRINRIEQDIVEMRHGHGFVTERPEHQRRS